MQPWRRQEQPQQQEVGGRSDVGGANSVGDTGEVPPSVVSKDEGRGLEAERPGGGRAAAAAALGSGACLQKGHAGGAAVSIPTFQTRTCDDDNTKPQHSPIPVQLHQPRPRVGHTISPFNLLIGASQQQQRPESKQQQRTLTCTREQLEQNRHQHLQGTGYPISSPQGSGRGDNKSGSLSASGVSTSNGGDSKGSNSKCNGDSSKCGSSSSNNGSSANADMHWARSLVRPVIVGGCCAAAAATAAAAAPNEFLHRVIERTSDVMGDAFLGFTAAEAAAALRQIPFSMLQQAAASAAGRQQQHHSFLPGNFATPLPAGTEKRGISAAAIVLERDWLERYISLLCAAGTKAWLWWRLPLHAAPGGPGITAAAAAACGVATPENRVHHAAASISAERQCSAVAVFGGRTASGALADNELYLLEVTPLLSLDLPLYILGDLLSLSLSEPARGVSGASASIDAPAEAEAGGAPRTAVFAEVGERVSSTCAGGADQRVPGGYCSGGSSTGSLPLLRWSVPLCLGQKPSPRLGHSMVYAEPHLILYGGKDGRGRLLNDVWLLDIFDWRPVAGPIAASEAAGVGSSGDVDPTSGSGGDAAAAGSARDITLSWIYLDFSSSPLKPPGRFLHSCSVFYTSANDGSCSIVIGGGWTSVVLPRSRLYALHRNAKGRWRHVILPVRVASAADRRFMHASVCAGSSLFLLGGLKVRLGAIPCAVVSPVLSHDLQSHRSASFPHALISALVGHQAWQIGGRVFCFGGLEINEDDAGPLRPVPVHRVVVVDACELLPASYAEALLATRYETRLQLQRRASGVPAAVPKRPLLPASDDSVEVGDAHCLTGSYGGGSNVGQRSMERQRPPGSGVLYSSTGAILPQRMTRPGTAPRSLPTEAPLAAAVRVAVTPVAAEGGNITAYSPRECAPADASRSCIGSKRPCSRPWRFDSSSLSKQEPTPDATAGATATAALPDDVAAAANDMNACTAASFEQLQGQGSRQEGPEGDPSVPGVIHSPHSLAVGAAAAAASSETCHPPDTTVCTPRRYRRMAALQALESFKLLPDTLGGTSTSAPAGASSATTRATEAAVAMPSTAKGI